MNVTCSDCGSVFRVDPAKVPPGGVRARCSVCGGVFAVALADAATVAAGDHARAEVDVRDEAPTTPEIVPPAAVGTAADAVELPPPAMALPRVEPLPTPPEPLGEVPAQPRPGRPFNPYLSNTPELRARRLARALVSDLVAYNPQKREQGLRDGTLRQLFREEIRKSWEEYVEQVGANVAESTPHFQDALNDVLAGGRRVF